MKLFLYNFFLFCSALGIPQWNNSNSSSNSNIYSPLPFTAALPPGPPPHPWLAAALSLLPKQSALPPGLGRFSGPPLLYPPQQQFAAAFPPLGSPAAAAFFPPVGGLPPANMGRLALPPYLAGDPSLALLGG
jgi:hypothetical protein